MSALTADEQAIMNRLASHSITAMAVDDDLATAAVADEYDLAIVGGRVASATIANQLTGPPRRSWWGRSGSTTTSG